MNTNNQHTMPKIVNLGSCKVGEDQETYFIAEIGNNHNGDFFIAKKSIEEAAKAGAHAVKFQKRFISETFAKELSEKPQNNGAIKGDTYGEYREGLEFSFEDFISLKKVAEENKVDFFVTPFDIKSADFLEEIGVPFYKIASFDLTNLPLLEHVAKFGKPIILSTGMASHEEVKEAVSVITKHHKDLILLHCVSVYPTPDEHINLGSMQSLINSFPEIPVGYSGHEQDILPSLIAISQGATIIERHFTLSRFLPGPDHGSVSIEPDVFRELVDGSLRIRAMQGGSEKILHNEEQAARDKHSKSIVVATPISKGTVITSEMLTCKSPGYGMKPRLLPTVIGKTAIADIEEDTVLRAEDIE